MYTANVPWQLLSQSSRYEFPGCGLSHPAESADKKEDIEAAGRAVVMMLELVQKPSDILTREALEDAITVTMARWFYKCHSSLTCYSWLMLICPLRTSIQSKNVCLTWPT